MNIIYPFLLVIHVIIALALIVAVLLQSSKGVGLAGAFGGGALTGAVFGGRGAATFLSKATTILAIGFMSSSILLFISMGIRSTGGGTGSKVLDDIQKGGTEMAPPAPTTVPGEAVEGGEQSPEVLFSQPPKGADTTGR